ncbi:2-oxoadipate dioxygenase/decarboxylase [Glycomyces dulcitolivorans]|uniref:2-oxoadipate dioxygenase/decarboxylase n=1 Tax=Glycomyces dulcitolivorans TaxID=2200759 RepID=UPI000DD46D1D|nr:VOC family protein [Glycomyces dulcitolivorans]
MIPTWQLRARFAIRLAEMYGTEVPAYHTLVDVCREVNDEAARARGEDGERLGSIERVTAERHGAIRVGSPREMAEVARVFAAFGMLPVGFYDLRDASASSVPVVSTAFRPIDAAELARNPFRVFTSMLVTEDRRFFDAETQERLEAFVAGRELFGAELLALADRAAAQEGLGEDDAERLLALATDAFRLTTEPIERDWYDRLERISAVAADIGGVPATHINHLTPRVLDIDELYVRMQARGITMISEIQGPPDWEGPDVLLRQTSFKALAEERVFRHADGSIHKGSLRVRFGEVEQRGIALTRKGRDVYDRLVAEADRRLAETPGAKRQDVARDVWREGLPATERELDLEGLGFFTYRVAGPAPDTDRAELRDLVASGVLVAEPIVYEDFLPRSAAGIFQSNLSDEGTRDDAQTGADYDLGRLAELVGAEIHDPFDLYAAQRDASLREAGHELGVRIDETTDATRSNR